MPKPANVQITAQKRRKYEKVDAKAPPKIIPPARGRIQMFTLALVLKRKGNTNKQMNEAIRPP